MILGKTKMYELCHQKYASKSIFIHLPIYMRYISERKDNRQTRINYLQTTFLKNNLHSEYV